MQTVLSTFAKPQPGPLYQRPLGLPPLQFPAKTGMDLVDPRRTKKPKPLVNDELRRYHASVHLTSGSGYAMNSGQQHFGGYPMAPQQPDGIQYTTMGPSQHATASYDSVGHFMVRHDSQSTFADENYAATPPKPKASNKPFPCSFADCPKAFARRSDLSRHERIHTGIRPHICDWPNCNRSFIQRSALTVHKRVHTGEKPHVCNFCSKAFSDSSSLARHRRIHSGRRPYKCEFANCQKTFTRRTTLTRHQNHHVGTTREQVQVEVDAVLATVRPQNSHRYSSDSSQAEDSHLPSPVTERIGTGSPYSGLPPMTINMQRHNSNGYAPHQLALPNHLRVDYQPQRPVTSYPTSYGPPPPPMEPPANGIASGSASPHHISWTEPPSNTLPAPFHADAPTYQEHGGFGNSQMATGQLDSLAHNLPQSLPYSLSWSQKMSNQLYYPPANGIGRPMSTEPKDYASQLQPHPTQMSSQGSGLNDWNQGPMESQANHPQGIRTGHFGSMSRRPDM